MSGERGAFKLIQERDEAREALAHAEAKLRAIETMPPYVVGFQHGERAAREEAATKLAAQGEALTQAQASIADTADRLDMASKRMSAKTGDAGLDRERDGAREAYFDAAHLVRDLLTTVKRP